MLKNFLLVTLVGTTLTSTSILAMEDFADNEDRSSSSKIILTNQDIEEKYLMEDDDLELCVNLWELDEFAPAFSKTDMESLQFSEDFTSLYPKTIIRGIHILGILNRENHEFFRKNNKFKLENININKINPCAHYVCHLNQDMVPHGWLQWDCTHEKSSFSIVQLQD